MGGRNWRDTDTDCPECGCSNTVEHESTGAVWCKSCGMEYVVK